MTSGRLLPALRRPAGRAIDVTPFTDRWTFWADYSVAPFAPIGPVQAAGFGCSWLLSGYGHAEAVLPVDQGSALSRAELLRLYSWRLWAMFDGEPVWGGLATDVDDDGGAAVTVALTELPGYLIKRQYDATRNYPPGTEQTFIAREIAGPVADIGVAIVTEPGPGFGRTRNYEYLEGQNRGELLTNLSEVISGPEFRSEYRADEATARPSCTLRIAYPRVGADTGLGVVVPGGAVRYRLHWTGGPMRTRTFAVGELAENAPANAKKPVVTVTRPQPGVPVLDEADDWPGVVLVSTLTERANANATIYAAPALALEAVMPVSAPLLHAYGVGDDVSVVLSDPLMPGALHATGRLVKAEADAAAGTVAWTVAVTSPPPRPGQTLAGQLAALRGQQTGMFHHNLDTPVEAPP